MSADGVVGIHVLVPHEPAGLVGTNGQKRNINAAEALAHLAKMPTVPRIAGKIDLAPARADNESTPQGAIAVARPPARPMLGRCQGYFCRTCRPPVCSRHFHALPPVQIVGRADAELLQKSTVTEAGYKSR